MAHGGQPFDSVLTVDFCHIFCETFCPKSIFIYVYHKKEAPLVRSITTWTEAEYVLETHMVTFKWPSYRSATIIKPPVLHICSERMNIKDWDIGVLCREIKKKKIAEMAVSSHRRENAICLVHFWLVKELLYVAMKKCRYRICRPLSFVITCSTILGFYDAFPSSN